MRTPNFEKWVAELRSTEMGQATSQLCTLGVDGQPEAMCCLGVGTYMLAEANLHGTSLVQAPGDSPVSGRFVTPSGRFYSLAPLEFIMWLLEGSEYEGRVRSDKFEFDLYPDLGEMIGDLQTQGGLGGSPMGGRDLRDNLTAAGMNDTGFTFAQIADVFDYFGFSLRGLVD